MPRTHDLPLTPFFCHFLDLAPKSPFLHTAPTNELEIPFRTSSSLVVRIWPRKGLVLGRWRKTGRGETEAILTAIQGRADALSTEEIRDFYRFDGDRDAAFL